MNYLKLTLIVLAISILPNLAEAAPFRQQIKVCADVPNTGTDRVSLHFVSTEFGTLWHDTVVSAGVGCIDFTYDSGPKNIHISVVSTNDFALDASCTRLGFLPDNATSMDLDTGTGSPHHIWSIVFSNATHGWIASCKLNSY